MAPNSDKQRFEERFEELYRATYQQIVAYCRRRAPSTVEADDAVAATFLVAWRRLDEVLAAEHPVAWLYGVAYRILANQYRASRRAAALRDRLRGVPPPGVPTPGWIVEQRADLTAAMEALRSLPVSDQELVRLVVFEQLTYAEMAVVLDTSVSAVKSRLFRARQRLRAAYQEHGGETPDSEESS